MRIAIARHGAMKQLNSGTSEQGRKWNEVKNYYFESVTNEEEKKTTYGLWH